MFYRILLFLLIILMGLKGEELDSFPSFQGFNGVVNTPNSEVLQEGEFEFLYTNQVDDFSPSSSIDFRENRKQESFLLNMGALPNLDFSLRYSHGTDKLKNRDYLSDRIINFKYQLSFIPKNIAKVAFGMQDIGGRAPHLQSSYIVGSKEFNNFRSSLGLAKGDNLGALDGVFGSLEYQPLPWLQIAGEYDTREWNGVLKTKYDRDISNNHLQLGVMAKSSLDYNDIYFGVYGKILFENKSKESPSFDDYQELPPLSISDLQVYGFSNMKMERKKDTLFFEYENSLYVYSDLDALGVVLGILATNSKSPNIVVTIKKGNVAQYTIEVDRDRYKKFLKTAYYEDDLIQFISIKKVNKELLNSDRFKPTLTIQPSFVLVDGSEYGHMDYTLAVQSELSMRVAEGTFLSARYNIPLTMTDIFKDGGIFDYRNRNKSKSEFDQLLLSQYFQTDLPYHWINLIQVGQFDKELNGISLESSISDLSGKHALFAKYSYLDDGLGDEMDLYFSDIREEKLLSYRYYMDSLNSNIKITLGEFLYGDKGVSISLNRDFSDISLKFDISETTHPYKGDHKVGKLTLSIPFGAKERFKSKYIDIKGDYLTYNRRKTIATGTQSNISQPHHLKEVNNNFTLEKYYLNGDRFFPSYIKKNYQRLRNIFLSNRN